MRTASLYTIEPAVQSDLADILRLLADCKLPLDGLAEHLSTCLVARQGDAVAGSVALEMYGRSALLRSLAVDESSRGEGLGKALTAVALEMAAQQDVGDVFLLTETAPAFFSRLGFVPIERSAVPEAVACSVEFTSACPVTAQAMRLAIRQH